MRRFWKLSGRAARPGARIVLSPVSWSMRISGEVVVPVLSGDRLTRACG
jgi:hypothetical protein